MVCCYSRLKTNPFFAVDHREAEITHVQQLFCALVVFCFTVEATVLYKIFR